eukprot:5074942-Alexandrium_andersonii.AAC.1
MSSPARINALTARSGRFAPATWKAAEALVNQATIGDAPAVCRQVANACSGALAGKHLVPVPMALWHDRGGGARTDSNPQQRVPLECSLRPSKIEGRRE